MRIIFHSYAKKTNFHMKSFALSLAFILRFTATRKWPIHAEKGPSVLAIVAPKMNVQMIRDLLLCEKVQDENLEQNRYFYLFQSG